MGTRKGLFGDLIKEEPKKSDIEKLEQLKKSDVADIHIGKNNSVEVKLASVQSMVEFHLGKYKNNVGIIHNKEELHKYIDESIKNGIIAIDTETTKGELGDTALDTLTCELVGVCLYTPNNLSMYVPVNHRDAHTNKRLENQVSLDDLKEELLRLNSIKQIYHNAKYDLKVFHWYLGIDLIAYWDTMLAAQLINENESHELKYLYAKYIEHQEQKEYDFNSLFRVVDYRIVPVEIASLYAATDAYVTYELYKFQENIINSDDYKGIKEVLFNIEMPLLPAIIAMENNGIELDTEMAKELSKKYHDMLDDADKKFRDVCTEFTTQLKKYRDKVGETSKLEDPINISSPTQIAILLYDVLGIKSPDKSKPRGTGEEILEKIDHPISKAILNYRGVLKLLSTYIDKLPQTISKRTNRIHASFNQYGAKTGRLSSSDPNLQNIPSHNKDIRKMFRARDGYVLVGSDFSQQEPRILSQVSGDDNLKNAYLQGKDLYAWGASLIFHLPYEDCLEFYPEGTKIVEDGIEITCGYKTNTNKAGKERRSKMKAILLGIMYSKGAKAIAEDLSITQEEAQELYNTFFKEFPKVKSLMDRSQHNAETLGYVTTIYGRRRRLPEMQLPPYEVNYANTKIGFNPLFEDIEIKVKNSDTTLLEKYKKALAECKSFNEKQSIKEKAAKEGIKILDNNGFISQARRQCVNSIIQGSAADMSKLALIKIHNDAELKSLGFKTLITVHDEIIGECPAENAEKAGERLSYVMINCAKDKIEVPMKCDVEISKNWYGTSINYINEYAEDYKNNQLRPIEYYNSEWREKHQK